MEIKSREFKNNSKIPDKFSCKGEDVNPSLEFIGVPDGTKSLVLIMDDPDAPMGVWDHWILFNIPSDVVKIEENSFPKDSIVGINTWGNNSYGGPCPPSGTHRYFFKLYAIDCVLDLDKNVKKEDVQKAIEGHVLEKAELIGLFSK